MKAGPHGVRVTVLGLGLGSCGLRKSFTLYLIGRHVRTWPKSEEGEGQDKTRQDKTRQDKTRQDKTRQDKTRQDKTRQDKTRQDKTRQDKTRQW